MRPPTHLLRYAACSLLCNIFSTAALADTIRIGGTGAALGTMSKLAVAFEHAHPQHQVNVMPSLGTSGGLKALQAGALHIAISARDVNTDEKSAGLSAYKYGTTAFIFVSHQSVPKLALDKKLIPSLYSGQQATWPNKQPVRLILRPKGDSDTKQLSTFSPAIASAVETAHAKSGMAIAITDTDAADQLENTPGGFGTSTLALVLSENRKLNIHAFDGVIPSIATLNNGKYVHTKDLYLVTTASATEASKLFSRFLRSPEAIAILTATGHRIPPDHSGAKAIPP